MVEERRLSPDQEQRKQAYEAVFAAGFATDYARMLVIGLFKKERLYLDEYATWEEYCEKKLLKSARHVDRLIQTAEVRRNIEEQTNLSEVVPEKECNPTVSSSLFLPNVSQATELSRLENPAEQVEVWSEVVASEEPVTASVVAAAVETRKAEKAYPSLGTAGLSAEEIRKAKALLDVMAEEEASIASQIVGQVGWPKDRALVALETLAGMESLKRSETLGMYQSKDDREKKAAISRMVRQKPAADPRRMTLEMYQPEVERCAKMFPDDPLTPELVKIARASKAVIDAIRQQEEMRNREQA